MSVSQLKRVQVALKPKCPLTTNYCDSDKIPTFFNAQG
ncbi:hypothetical protein GXM_06251 [Nostoc sphaeroides CCNUC1]|uniref:Uncharacterized protein n=1 Tax=Nostoc sphaeroides CCNUC1 TaxID=2653204 RepID=A0A5P8W7K6_9NOSO|nr:hypothetical protein GXM_06251 [Nostoc sphaeroides CCNUC1]